MSYTRFDKIKPEDFIAEFGADSRVRFEGALKGRVITAASWVVDALPKDVRHTERFAPNGLTCWVRCIWPGEIDVDFKISVDLYDTVPSFQINFCKLAPRGRAMDKFAVEKIMPTITDCAQVRRKAIDTRRTLAAREEEYRKQADGVRIPEGYRLHPHMHVTQEGEVSLMGWSVAIQGRSLPGFGTMSLSDVEIFFAFVEKMQEKTNATQQKFYGAPKSV